MLVLGVAAALAVDPKVKALFESWAAAGGLFGPVWLAVSRAARFNETLPQMGVDYAISVINVGAAVFLVWKRPHDWVARLFGLAFVGTAMGYNYQAHSVVAIAAGSNAALGGVPGARDLALFHWIFHAVGGVAYVHALLIFPNGRLVPRRAVWLLVVLYGIMLEELFYPAYNILNGIAGNPPLIVLILQDAFNALPLQNYVGILQAEVVFFVLLFGVLTPLVGIGAQLYRYRRESSAVERQQTRLVIWALTISFSIALVFMGLGVVALAASGTVFSGSSSFLLEQILLHVTPPLYAVLPIVLLVAIFRYRLLDIQVVIDRTLIYGPLTSVLALLFLASLFVLQQILKSLIGQPSELAVAGAAFVNAIFFQPVRRRVQAFVDERFFARGPAPEPPSPEPAVSST